jgi:hypothetical protein
MRTFGLKALTIVVAALAGVIIVHSLIYLSVDPGILSAQMPISPRRPMTCAPPFWTIGLSDLDLHDVADLARCVGFLLSAERTT